MGPGPIDPSLATEARAELDALERAHAEHARRHPGVGTEPQPVHTVYGGAHLYKAESARRLGDLARAALDRHAPDGAALARVLGIDEALASRVRARVVAKLEREPVEDQRIDFEDGFGVRPDTERDEHAVRAARELARAMHEGLVPAGIGIRIESLSRESAARAVRTLELFVSTLAREAGAVPPGFVVTLPKVAIPEEPRTLVRLLERLERRLALEPGALRMELMIELTQAIVAPDGRWQLPLLLDACEGRCVAAHFGTYDFTASAGVSAEHQTMDHPVARAGLVAMQLALSGRGIRLSDGATTLMPIGETEAVHAAWRAMYRNVRGSLALGLYQGWDLHPAQIPIRYAAVHAFFLEALPAATARLANFLEKAAQATRVGAVFDDAATGQGLLNTMLRGVASGAIDEPELAAAGLTMDEIRTRSFARILEARSSIDTASR